MIDVALQTLGVSEVKAQKWHKTLLTFFMVFGAYNVLSMDLYNFYEWFFSFSGYAIYTVVAALIPLAAWAYTTFDVIDSSFKVMSLMRTLFSVVITGMLLFVVIGAIDSMYPTTNVKVYFCIVQLGLWGFFYYSYDYAKKSFKRTGQRRSDHVEGDVIDVEGEN